VVNNNINIINHNGRRGFVGGLVRRFHGRQAAKARHERRCAFCLSLQIFLTFCCPLWSRADPLTRRITETGLTDPAYAVGSLLAALSRGSDW